MSVIRSRLLEKLQASSEGGKWLESLLGPPSWGLGWKKLEDDFSVPGLGTE